MNTSRKNTATPSAFSLIISLNRLSAEEASRYGHEKIDLEHLLLALTLTDTPAGQALRSHGVTWNAVTEAIRGLSAARLENLGITSNAPLLPTQRITTTGTTPRLKAVFKKGAGTQPDLIQLTQALLDEPSGTIAHILEKIGAHTESIREQLNIPAVQVAVSAENVTALEDSNLTPTHQEEANLQQSRPPSSHSGTAHKKIKQTQASAVIPATTEAVDRYIHNPLNLSEWEPVLLGREIEENPDGEGWIAQPSTNHAGENQSGENCGHEGRCKRENQARAKAKTTFAIQRKAGKPLTWEISKLGYANAPTLSIILDTQSAQDGTAFTVTARWEFPHAASAGLAATWRAAQRAIVAWWAHIIRKMYARNIAHSISRAIREQHVRSITTAL